VKTVPQTNNLFLHYSLGLFILNIEHGARMFTIPRDLALIEAFRWFWIRAF